MKNSAVGNGPTFCWWFQQMCVLHFVTVFLSSDVGQTERLPEDGS